MFHGRIGSRETPPSAAAGQLGSRPRPVARGMDAGSVVSLSGQALRSRRAPELGCLDELAVVRGPLPSTLLAQWRDLERSAAMTPFQRQDWLERWWTHLGSPAAEPVTAFGYGAEQLVLVLPLVLERRHGLRMLVWRGDRVNDYCGPVATKAGLQSLDSDQAMNLLRIVAGAVGGVDLAYLTKQPRQLAGLPNPFVGAGSCPYHVGAHAIRLGTSWEAFYAGRRSSGSRRRHKDKLRALGKLGAVRFEVVTRPAERARLVDLCIAMKSEQLRQQGFFDPFAQSRARQLLAAHAAAAEEDSFWVVALMLDDRPIAVSFGFADRSEWLLYQIAMERGESARFSPGTILLQSLMQHCIGKGVGRLDLSLGDENYKMAWCDEHERLHLTLLPLSLPGQVFAFAHTMWSRLHREIVARPAVHVAAKRLRAVLAGQGGWSTAFAPLLARRRAASGGRRDREDQRPNP